MLERIRVLIRSPIKEERYLENKVLLLEEDG